MGVPMIGCACPVCLSTDPKNKRLRPSVLLQYKDRNVLIDITPDFRQQALQYGLTRLDAILITHSHADHILGLDDVRPLNHGHKQPIPCYGSRECIEEISITFRYIFKQNHYSDLPRIDLRVIEEAFAIFDRTILPIPVMHAGNPIFGYRVNDFAYLTDVSFIPETSYPLLTGLKVLVLGALRHKPHAGHFTLEQAVHTARRIGAEATYFTHMCHHLEHEQTNADLPEGIQLSYDGLTLDL